jgi:chromosome segregation ATPase
METFIKHQMMAILQPFAEQVQSLDAELVRLGERLDTTDGRVQDVQKGQESTNTNMLDLQSGLRKTNARLTTLRDGLEASNCSKDLVQQGLFEQKSHVQRLQVQLEATVGQVAELQRSMKEAEGDIASIQANTQKSSDGITNSIKGHFDSVQRSLDSMKTSHDSTRTSLDQMKLDLKQRNEVLQETREITEKNTWKIESMNKVLTSNVSRATELCDRFKEASDHRAKLQHGLDTAELDVALLKKNLQHHDTSSQELKEAHESMSTNFHAYKQSHEKMGNDVRTLQHQVLSCQQGLSDTREGLGKTTELANKLHASLQDTNSELRKACLQLDENETKQNIIKENLDKTNECVTDLVRGHRKAVGEMHSLHHELGKTNETLHTARGQIESTNAGLSGLKGDLVRTKDTLERVDRGMESCHQSFSGLRKGFQETGAHLSTRPMTLPKLTQERLTKVEMRPLNSPDLRKSPGKPKSCEGGHAGLITAWAAHGPKDDDASTECSEASSRTGTRGSSVCGPGTFDADTRRSSASGASDRLNMLELQ